MAPVIRVIIFFTFLATTGGTPDSDSSSLAQTKTITHKINYLPPMLILGFPNGTISRCPYESPNSCEVYYAGNSSVTANVVHGEFLFASLESGAILRCLWEKKHSCSILHQIDQAVTSLAVASGFIYAGLYNETILRCEMTNTNSCRTFTNYKYSITSLGASGSSIYAGSYFLSINRCSEDGCINLDETGCPFAMVIDCETLGLAIIGRDIYGVRNTGWISRFNEDSGNSYSYIIGGYKGYVSLATYGRKLYVLKRKNGVYLVNLDRDQVLTLFAEHPNAATISFAYGTYAIQEQYRTESEKCINLRCPPKAVYYDAKSRATFEVFVKDGSLYDSRGLLDTSDADDIYLQKAAIFVMGPDGQILLSKFHKLDLLRTSSLLAGGPVSGAGLMVVERGKITRISACSAHYMPDVKLNEQVIEVLYTKGYTGKIDSRPCIFTSVT